VRIQLDYYRILGLTPQAKTEQINQAHGDRIKSLPLREYSDQAISARQKLLNIAHTVLADNSQRQLYDAQILPELIQSKDAQAFFIEIDKRDLSGALLILYELGEYDQIIELNKVAIALNAPDSDVILSTVLAYLELGRENWNQGKYESASEKFNYGLDSLAKFNEKTKDKSGAFPGIKQELQKNIWQLRPYRVLELMSSGMTLEGMILLKELLEERRGIDGKGDDHSGLNIDKFLQFILELRVYMTSSEQEELFEAEARRPSLVASYLGVYALMAKGISQRQPPLIRRAKSLLSKIGSSQNVYLEEAICALLMGQLADATKMLDLSNETERLDLIHQLSKPEYDQVKGLYNYTQTWLSTEIYPNFKDLIGLEVDLDAYFNDPNVQAYIDELPNTSPVISPLQVSISPDPVHIFKKPEPASFISETNPETQENITPQNITPQNITVVASRGSSRSRTKVKPRYKFHPERLILFLVGFIIIVGGSVALGFIAWNSFQSAQKPIAQSEPLITPIIEASIANIKPIAIATPNLNTVIDRKVAEQIVISWQKIKANALGSKYKVIELDQILMEPLLSDWRSRAKNLKSANSHLEYTLKSAVVKEFKLSNKNQASALTNISEVRNFFTNGQLIQQDSKEDSYQVEYVLTRKGDRWMISAMNLKP
jgi:tetratricopeptide (TPR) repeat protein